MFFKFVITKKYDKIVFTLFCLRLQNYSEVEYRQNTNF